MPAPVHRKLKARAAASGMSMSEYLRVVLERAASRPTPSELAATVRARSAASLGEDSAAAVRRLRDRGE